jgi:amino acid adenylation domain-containing protein/thioester reductase-like protein
MRTTTGEKRKCYPLTHAQKRIYYDTIIHPDAPWANISFLVKYKKKLDFKLLERSINKAVQENDGLRLRIMEFDFEPEPLQDVAPYKEQSFDYIDFSGADPERRLKEWVDRMSQTPFEFQDNDLFYFACIKFSENESGYYLKIHHTIADGWSCYLLFTEINEIYENLQSGKRVDNIAKPSYLQYIKDEKEYLESPLVQLDKKFWHGNLLPLPKAVSLSSGVGNPDNIKANDLILTIPDNLRSMMHKYCRNHETSLYKLLLSAFSIYIFRVTGIEDMAIAGVNHNRSTDNHKKMMGMFVSTFPIRIKIDENMTFNRLLEKNEKDINCIVKNHQKYPFDILATEIKEISDSNTGYLLDFSVIGHSDIKRKDFSIEYVFPGYLPGALLIHLNISNKDKNGILELLWCYQVERFSKSDIMRIHHRLINVLKDVLSQPDKKILEIDLLSPVDKDQILYSFNKTQGYYPKDRTIHQEFAEQVEKTPDNIVLVFQEKHLTYRGLNENANQLARVLRKKRVEVDNFVGLMVDRSLEMILGMMAVLKSGGAYLPIDPDYPDKRILYMLKDSEAGFLLTQQKYEGRIDLEIELIDMEDRSLYKGDTQNLPLRNNARNLAYAIYTSGSTGMPKGVMIEHNSVINLAYSQMNTFKIDEKEKIFQFSSMCFDASVEQIYIALFSGAALVLIDKTVLLNIDKFEVFIDNHSLTHIHGVPAFVSTIPVKKYKNLKRMISGGDVCPPLLVKRWLKYCDFCNEYGPTETTVTSIELLLKKSENLQYRFSIGNALNNTFIYILDKHMRVVPIGVPGELCIGGAGVARGYLNRPELTAEKFIRNTFGRDGRIYKTGDLSRWLPDGNIDFLGRIDFQVKIRGFRIETGEIETRVLMQKKQKINDAVVIPREDIAGEKYLCAYIVSDKKIDMLMLEDSLSENLPDYMVPSYFVQIENIPLTPTGKVDRKALPVPEIKEKGADYVAPRNEIEEKLVEIWSELLHLEKYVISIDDIFFKLGGHSLKAAVMITMIHKELNVKVLMHQVFEMSTIRRLGEYIKGAREEEFTSIEPVEEKEYYPQASAQKRIYFIEQLEKDSILYNLQLMDVYCKGIEKEALEVAFKKLIKRHESLRSSFFTMNGEAVQKVYTCEEVIQGFKIEYWETAEDGMIYSEEPGKEWTKVTGLPFQEVIEYFVRPFDLTHPPLLRAGFIKIWGNTKILMLDMHHIVSDGVSNVTLIKDLWRLYDEEELPRLKIQYKDFAEWGNSEKQKVIIKKQELFWLNEFQGEVPVLNLPYDYPRPAKMSFDGDMLHFEISIEETRKLNVIAQEQGQTLYMVLFAVYVVLLAKLSGQDDIAVGTVTAGRRHADLQPIIGIFVETLVVHNYPAGNKTFREFLKEVKQRILRVFENQYYPFEELVSKVASRQDASRNPLFDVLFVLDNEAAWFEEYLHEVLMLNTPNPYKIQRSKFDITLIGAETGEGLQFNIEFSTQLFKEETIDRFIDYFKKIVSSICNDSDQKISEIEIIPDLERGLILYSFNDTESMYPSDKTIHELFEVQAAKTPENTAVKGMTYCTWEKELTYRELNEKVNALTRLLREKGVLTDDIAAIMVEPSQEMIIGLLAILKAGGAFLPIDHKIPPDRIKYILEESGTRNLLTREEFPEEIFFGGEIIELNNRDIYKGDQGNPISINKAGDMAYVIYTSGSTGKPKGVMVEHRSLTNLCFWHNIYYSVTDRDQAIKYAGFGFDASVWEVFPYLVIGAALHIVPEEIKLDIKALNRYFEDNGITIGFLPTQFCEQFMTIDNTSLRVLLTGGDKLKTFTKKNYQLFNNYGPTENTVVATSFPVSKFKSNIPIGKPVYNNQIYILDNSDNIQPIGVPGELCIGGDSLARGYLNNPELTSEKFTANPYSPPAVFQLDGKRLYRTGDLVRWLADGNIEFLGRIDYQVKIRGFRIELGEIENQLLHIEDIKEAVVIANEDSPGQKYLMAYIVPYKTGVNMEFVKEKLAKNLPEYMIPVYFVQLKRIPINPSGKIDTKALPAPDVKGIEYAAPTSDIEKLLAEIWSGVLGIEKIGIDDNFFNSGGDSIKTIMVSARLQKHGIAVDINNFFSYPTIRQLTSHVKKIEPETDKKNIKIKRDEEFIARQIKIDYEKYLERIRQEKWSNLRERNRYKHILLTGATGYLGAYLLYELLNHTEAVLYLLVRGKTQTEAQDRLKKRLSFYFGQDFFDSQTRRIVVIKADLRKEQMGIEDDNLYKILCNAVNSVVHSAANVKHYGVYEELYKDNVEGTERLLEFAKTAKKKDVHYISTISVGLGEIPGQEYNLFTEYQNDVGQRTNLVYTRSKFEAERKVLAYREKGITTSVYRAGNLTFHSETGRFQQNIEENSFYSMIKAIAKVGFLSQKMKELAFDFSFINYAARAITLLLTTRELKNETYHIANPDNMSLNEIAEWIKESGVEIPEVEEGKIEEHLAQFEGSSEYEQIIERVMLDSWAWEEQSATMTVPKIDRTVMLLKKLGFEWPKVTREHIEKMITHSKERGFL